MPHTKSNSTSRRKSSSRTTPRIHKSLQRFSVPVGKLSADPANLRVHGDESVAAIAASLSRFGQRKPIVVDARGVTIAGAGTLAAAKSLGWSHVAAVRQEDLTGAERIAFAIADNRSAELSTWDVDALQRTAKALPPELLAAAGFTAAQLAELTQDRSTREDSPVATAAKPVSKLGDLWHLGEQRLLCGDSTKAADVDRVLAGQRPKLIATDPPYVIDYTGQNRGNGSGKDWSNIYREIDIPDASAFFVALFTQIARVMDDGAAVYCWHASSRYPELVAAWKGAGLLDHQIIIWAKPVGVFGRVFWPWRHEPCLMGWKQGSKPRHDGRHDADSVWQIAGAEKRLEDLTREDLVELLKQHSSLWEIDWEGKARVVGNEHPTQKPVEIFARPMRKHTAVGDVVFEPFSGSGSQLIAAEQTGRRCRAIELEPVFVDAAVRRWQTFTGKQALLGGKKGQTLEVVAKARGIRLRAST